MWKFVPGTLYLFPGGRGVLPERLGIGVRPASLNPSPIYDQNLRLSLPYMWPDHKYDTLFMTWLLDHYGKCFCCWLHLACAAGAKRGWGRQSADVRRKLASSKKKTELKTGVQKSIPYLWPKWRKMAKINTLFMTKTAENHTLWGHSYLYSPYKGVPPGVCYNLW